MFRIGFFISSKGVATSMFMRLPITVAVEFLRPENNWTKIPSIYITSLRLNRPDLFQIYTELRWANEKGGFGRLLTGQPPIETKRKDSGLWEDAQRGPGSNCSFHASEFKDFNSLVIETIKFMGIVQTGRKFFSPDLCSVKKSAVDVWCYYWFGCVWSWVIDFLNLFYLKLFKCFGLNFDLFLYFV